MPVVSVLTDHTASSLFAYLILLTYLLIQQQFK